jgi:hypothetical protein
MESVVCFSTKIGGGVAAPKKFRPTPRSSSKRARGGDANVVIFKFCDDEEMAGGSEDV